METYEIRILRLDGRPGCITQQKYLNDDAAVAAAKFLAGARRFEVWIEDYRLHPKQPHSIPHPPDLPAA
jgi:hypothetical protein